MQKTLLIFTLILSMSALLFLACGDNSTDSNADTEFASQIIGSSTSLAINYLAVYVGGGAAIYAGGVFNVIDSTADPTFIYDINNYWWTYNNSYADTETAYILNCVYRDSVRISADSIYQIDVNDSTDMIEYISYCENTYDYSAGVTNGITYNMSGQFESAAEDTLSLNGDFISSHPYAMEYYEYDLSMEGEYSDFVIVNETILSGLITADIELSVNGDSLSSDQAGDFAATVEITILNDTYQAVFNIEGDIYTDEGNL